MQLKGKKIAGILSCATATLLGAPAQADEAQWDVDSAVLLYSEKDRVSAFEPVISLKKDLGDDEILSMKLTLDSLTGASANGAVPSTMVQTFTSPSGGKNNHKDDDDDDDEIEVEIEDDDDDEHGSGSYTAKANETPLDDTFRDARAAFSLSWDKPINRNNRTTLGVNFSKEYDFLSLGGNMLWQHEMNQKNTTLSTGISVEKDIINAVGGAPVGLTDMALGERLSGGDRNKQIVDLIFGVTQIIDKTSLFQLNLSLSESDGYMTDPYKILSVVNDVTGEPDHYVYEKRPESRSKQSVYGKYKKMLPNSDIISLSYRFMTDDWDVNSHTFDLTYKYKLSGGYFIQPNVRLYEQSAAKFYRYFLLNSESLPQYASADYRLGDLQTTSFGIKFGKEIDDRHVWSARLAMYTQSGDSSPDEAVGQLKNQDLFPDVEAIIMQVNYSFKW